jgi:hypothetical protein
VSPIEFPFERGHDYSFGQLRAFQANLSRIRQSNQAFSADLRCNNLPWVKTYSEELFPILLLAIHKGATDNDCFCIMPAGDTVDLNVRIGKEHLHCQVTVASPIWANAAAARGTGYFHRLEMELLRQGKPAFGGGDICKEDGIIISKPRARDALDDVESCRRGLVASIKRKQKHAASGVTLVVYARDFRFALIDFDLAQIVGEAVALAGGTLFERIYVVDQDFGWWS